MPKKVCLVSLVCLMSSVTSISSVANAAPKNIIYMIGDGMGATSVAAYRYFMDDPTTKAVERTIFDELWIGNASTYPDDDTVVTDSAAAATALSSTHKTYNGAIAVDHQHHPLTTMMEIAKAKGMQTGIVVTAQINHATPASFLAHDKQRYNYNEIADDYIDNKVEGRLVADLLLGGGTSYFARKDRNLVQEFKQAGYHYTDQWSELATINSLPALGLFAPKGLVSALDNPEPLPLKQMTQKALQLLSPAEKGFVVMIEGSQIDWCAHANDIACTMAEMHDFAEAVKVAKAYVDNNPDTILVVTADHETGGLALGAQGKYSWNSHVVKKISRTAEYIAGQLVALKDDKVFYQAWLSFTALELNANEQKLLSNAREQGLQPLATAIKQHINHHSLTGWTSSAHTASDVPVMAHGIGKQQFAGFQDNTEIATKLIDFIRR